MGHHLTNNILHAINTVLVMLLVARLIEAAGKFSGLVIPATPYSIRGRRESFRNTLKDSGQVPTYLDPEQIGAGMTEKKQSSRLTIHDSRFTLIAAGITGLLFGLHPIHVESVAWVAERKDLLHALFFLLSIMMYVEYADSITPLSPSYLKRGWQSRGRYLLALFFFVLALLGKPMAVSLPVVLLILDWYPFERIRSFKTFFASFVEKVPFIVFSLISSELTIMAQKGAMGMMEIVPLSTRLLVAAKNLVVYLWKMAVPLNLIPFYPYPNNVSLFSLKYLFAVVLTVGITAFCVIVAKKHKLWVSVFGYYVVTLIPALGIVQVGLQEMADRFTYLPSLGPFLIAGLAAARLSERLYSKRLKIACGAAAISAFVLMSYLTFKQISIWQNSITLWSYAIERGLQSFPIAYTNRGVAFEKNGQFDRAIDDYRRAIALSPSLSKPYNNLGVVYDKLGRFDEAIENYDRAIALDPLYSEAYNNRGAANEEMGRLEKAMEDYDKAIALNPLYYEAYYNRGTVEEEMDRLNAAFDDYNKAMSLNPSLCSNDDLSHVARQVCSTRR